MKTTTIKEQAFEGCIALGHIYYGGTHEQWSTVSIGSENESLANARIHCNAPAYVPDLVLPAELTRIEYEAFSGGMFTYVYVPASVKNIGPRAFADCSELQYVEIASAATEIDPKAFEGVGGLIIDTP